MSNLQQNFPLGKSFRIEDILASQHGKYLSVQGMWWKNFAKMQQGAPVGGQSSENSFITMSKCDPLLYDGISKQYSAPVINRPSF